MATLLWISLLAAVLPVEGFWRLPCGRIQLGRLDPIISPGGVSGHVHTISGPNNFDVSSSFDTLTSAYCTSCPVQADKSAYWTPQLYYRYANGTFSAVGSGGTIVYYLDRGDNLADMIAFPEGLQMVSGDPGLRSYSSSALTWSGKRPIADRVSFACINYSKPQIETNGFNVTDCPQGLRAQIHFQSCWDGQNLYKADQSHVAYLDRIDNGACPPTHPKLLPHLFYEIYYDVAHIEVEDGGYYVFAQGDATGYGFHGDFQNGWNKQVLTDAIAQCMGPTAVNNGGTIEGCPPFAATLDGNSGRNCPEQPSIINETVTGLLTQLPGCNPPTFGPDRAAMQVCSVEPNIVSSKGNSGVRALPFPGNRTGDFAYVGCARDNVQTLAGPSYTDDKKMTIETCSAFCRQNKFVYAGLENGRQCNCGNVIMSTLQTNGSCSEAGITCSGNIGQYCGGDNVLHIWNDTATTLPPTGMPRAGQTTLNIAGSQATYGGCYLEADGRALRGASFSNDTGMTNELCGGFCQARGFPVFGTEYAQECYCGTAIATQTTAESDCTMVCKGESTQFCGAGNRLSIWSIVPRGSSSSSTLSKASSTTMSSMTSTTPLPTVSGGLYVGCISETNPRALNADSNSVNTQSLEGCAQLARDKNYRYFGLEYSSECYVDDLVNTNSKAISESACNMRCSGNKQQTCGGPNAISLFNNTAYTPRIPLSIQTANNSTYTYQGCYADQGSPRTLQGFRVSQNSNSVDACVQLCNSRGYAWAGVEYGSECYCSNTGTGTAAVQGDGQCSKPCAANVQQNCGGSMALQVYQLKNGP